MNTHRLKSWIAALCLGLALAAAPVVAMAAPVAPSTSEPAPTVNDDPLPAHQSPSHEAYARREAATPRAASFKGDGASVYIGGSTVAVVLIVVLIVVLL